MQYIVFRFKDTRGRKGSKTTCTPARHSFLTFLSASCSWQQINCVVVIWGLFLFISLCGASQDSPRACRCPVQGAWAMLGAVPGVCRAPSTPPPNPALQPVWVCMGHPGCQEPFVPLSSGCSTGSCAGCNLLELWSTREEVIKSIRFNFIASLILEISGFENYHCIHKILGGEKLSLNYLCL